MSVAPITEAPSAPIEASTEKFCVPLSSGNVVAVAMVALVSTAGGWATISDPVTVSTVRSTARRTLTLGNVSPVSGRSVRAPLSEVA